jgi:hypothetical protein
MKKHSLQWGFAGIADSWVEKHQFILFSRAFITKTLKPTNLKGHFEQTCKEFVAEDLEYI